MNNLFPAGVGVAWAPLDGTCLPMSTREAASVTHASSKRRIEFSAGRHLGHRLLRSLGHPNQSITRKANGAPEWPQGIVGSISHCEGLCVVAAAESDQFGALGLDVEPNEPIEQEIWVDLFTPKEQETLRLLDPGAINWSRLFFSAKEAFYKASSQEGISSFLDLETSFARGSLRVSSVHPGSPPRSAPPNMTYRLIARWLVTAAWTDRELPGASSATPSAYEP